MNVANTLRTEGMGLVRILTNMAVRGECEPTDRIPNGFLFAGLESMDITSHSPIM